MESSYDLKKHNDNLVPYSDDELTKKACEEYCCPWIIVYSIPKSSQVLLTCTNFGGHFGVVYCNPKECHVARENRMKAMMERRLKFEDECVFVF